MSTWDLFPEQVPCTHNLSAWNLSLEHEHKMPLPTSRTVLGFLEWVCRRLLGGCDVFVFKPLLQAGCGE